MGIQFAVGDKVRSYDFQPMECRGDCYMEGIVTEVDTKYGCLKFTTTKCVFDGTDISDDEGILGRPVQTALPGNLFFGEWEGRLTVIEKGC